MELLLFMFLNIMIMAFVVLGHSSNRFFIFVGGLLGFIITVALLIDNSITDTYSSYATVAFPYAWLPILLTATAFIEVFRKKGR